MKRFTRFILPVIFIIVLWEIISYSNFVNSALFPPPSEVVVALWTMIKSGIIIKDLQQSLWRLFIGLFLGSIVGVILGVLTGRKKIFNFIFSPIIQVLRPLPPVAIVPLIIVWFGIGDGAKIFSIAFAVFFPVWINTHIGSKQVDNTLLWSAKLLTNSNFKILHKVILPSALPFIVAGIRTAIAVAFIMVFVSELSGASSGLGYRVSISHLVYRIDEMMAALVILGALGALTDQLFIFITNKIYPWLKNYSK